MYKLLFSAIFLTLFGAFQMTAQAQDLSMRQAAYFQFYSDGKIDLKTPYVTPGSTFKINKGAATSKNGDGLRFAIGFILFRDVVTFPPAGFKVDLTAGSNTSSLIFQFANGEKTVQARHETPLLKMGLNKVKVVIDPDNKVAESNESNNSFEFNIEVVEDKKDGVNIKAPKGGEIIKLPKGKN